MLSNREKEVLTLMAAGLSTKEIADHIHRSPETVKKTIANIKTKSGLQKATELVAEYFCQLMDTDFTEFKKKVLSASMLTLVVFAEYHHLNEYIRVRTPQSITLMIAKTRNLNREEDFNLNAA